MISASIERTSPNKIKNGSYLAKWSVWNDIVYVITDFHVHNKCGAVVRVVVIGAQIRALIIQRQQVRWNRWKLVNISQ